mgnify:CR=1 FL=1
MIWQEKIFTKQECDAIIAYSEWQNENKILEWNHSLYFRFDGHYSFEYNKIYNLYKERNK